MNAIAKIALMVAAVLMIGGVSAAMPHGQSPHGWHPGHQQGDWLSPDSWLGQKHQQNYRYSSSITGTIGYNGASFQYTILGDTMHVKGYADRTLAHHIAHMAFDFKPRLNYVIFDHMGWGFAANEHRGHRF